MNQMQQMIIQMQKAQRELQKAEQEISQKEYKINKAGLLDIVVLGSKEIVSINVEEDGFEADNKEMIEDLIKDGLNELFAQIDEEFAKVQEKIASRSGGFGF